MPTRAALLAVKFKAADLPIEENGALSGLAEVARSRALALGVELIVVRSAATPARPFSKTTWRMA